jgi:hypothetical protein
MIIVLDGQYNPNSSKAIEATSIQSPFDTKPPNLNVSYINPINIPWADSKSILRHLAWSADIRSLPLTFVNP